MLGVFVHNVFEQKLRFHIDTMLQCPKVIQNVLINEKLNISPFLHVIAIQLHIGAKNRQSYKRRLEKFFGVGRIFFLNHLLIFTVYVFPIDFLPKIALTETVSPELHIAHECFSQKSH